MTQVWPLPATSGAQLRTLNVSKLLSRIGDVSFAIVERRAFSEDAVRLSRRELDVQMVLRVQLAAARGPLHRLRHELDATYLADYPAISCTDRTELLNMIQKYDLVWVHNIKTANLCGIFRWPKSVLDVDDLLSGFYRSRAQTDNSLMRQLLDLRLSCIWRKRERLLADRFDVLTVCSEKDKERLGRHPQIRVIPNGFHPQVTARRPVAGTPRIGFIGALRYPPNHEGVTWFVRNVWPSVKREFPRAHLRLIGEGGDEPLAKLGPDITELGWMEDPGEEIASWSAMIVPIRSGAGTRIKVAEGFARKCPIVSTAIGAFGYNVHDEEEILLADKPGDFASACIRLLQNPQLGEALSERAHQRFLREWTWDSFEDAVAAAVQDCLAPSNRIQMGGARNGNLDEGAS